MEPSDILLGLLLTFSRLVDCSLLLTRYKVTDFKFVVYMYTPTFVCVKFFYLKFGVIRQWPWPGVCMSPSSLAV